MPVSKSPMSGNWFHISGLVPEKQAHRVSVVLMEAGAYDVTIRPVMNAGPKPVEEILSHEASPKPKRRASATSGPRAPGSGAKGQLRRFLEAQFRNGAPTVTSKE